MKLQVLRRMVFALLLAFGFGMLATEVALAQENDCTGGDRVAAVTRFGNPRTTFSSESADTMADLQRLFVEHRADLERVLALTRWGGDPEDLFAAVASGEGVSARAVEPLTEFDWMAYRKRGEAACVNNLLWRGKEPFPAWNIQVSSNGYSYNFVVPEACLNLAIERGTTRLDPPPTASLSATFDAEGDVIDLTGTTDCERMAITDVQEPDGAGDLAKVGGADGTWTYPPTADGRYEFTATGVCDDGRTATASAGVDVERIKPEGVFEITTDPESGVLTIDGSGSTGDVSIKSVIGPDGQPVTEGLVQTGPNQWTFDPSASLPAKPGDYEYQVEVVTEHNGMTETKTITMTATRDPRGGNWIVRGYLARADVSTGAVMTAFGGPGIEETRIKRSISGGDGFGLGVEYLFGEKLGFDVNYMNLDLDGNLVIDIGEDWFMSTEEVSFEPLELGLNYHFGLDRLVDVYLGPIVSFIDFGGSSLNDGENFDSEVGFGAKVGADIYFGWQSPWALSITGRYLTAGADSSDADFDVDPLIGTIGLSYRF